MTTQRDNRRDGVGGDGWEGWAQPSLPPPRGGLQPLPPPAAVPSLPPRSQVPAPVSFDRHADGPTATAMAVGAPAPPPQIWSPDGVIAAHRAINAERRAGVSARRGSSFGRRLAAWTIVLVAVAAMGVVVVQLALGVQDASEARSLPAFTERRPVAGTVVVEVEEAFESIDERFTGTVTANPNRTEFHLDGADQVGPIEMVASDGIVYGVDDDGWFEADRSAADDLVAGLVPVVRVSIFADYVPTEAREHTAVIGSSDEQVRGHDVRRIELLVDDEAFRRADRQAYDLWAAANLIEYDPSDQRPLHLEVWVDEDGVIWRFRSEGRNARTGELEEYVQYDLMSFEATSYSATMPVSGVSASASA